MATSSFTTSSSLDKKSAIRLDEILSEHNKEKKIVFKNQKKNSKKVFNLIKEVLAK